MKVQSSMLAMAVALGAFATACSSNDSGTGTGGSGGTNGSGGGGTGSGGTSRGSGGSSVGSGGTSAHSSGSSSSGGSSGTGGGSGTKDGGSTTCSTNVSPCGGNLVGTWNVSSSCLTVSGDLDISGVSSSCSSTPVTGSLRVTGSFTANADGSLDDQTVTTGTELFSLDAKCMEVSSTPVDSCDGMAGFLKSSGFATVTCTTNASKGCDCSTTINQTGGIGFRSPSPADPGTYTSSVSTLTVTGGYVDQTYSYCVSGTKLTMVPSGDMPTVAGSVALDKSGSGGSGGSSGSSGAGGSGGGSSSSGTTGRGGASGTGGASGSGGGSSGVGGSSGSGGSSSTGTATGPCDIYKAGGNTCVAAHSTVRALFGSYSGKLYQVKNSGGTTKDISAVRAGGPADGAAQDTFCSGTTCVITCVYDQSGTGNDLWYQGSDSPVGGKDKASTATKESLKVGGSEVYSLYIDQGNSYWVDASKSGIPLGSEPEAMYMVTSGKHVAEGCCFDYGNAETGRSYVSGGHMDALNFSTSTAWGYGNGSGPWVEADLEAGMFTGSSRGKNDVPSLAYTFVTAVLKNNGTTEFALRGGDATTGNLQTLYKGALPAGYNPMKKEGAIVLGSGGDCCKTNTNLSAGTFYEGVIVKGYPSDATEDSVQANIVAAGYATK